MILHSDIQILTEALKTRNSHVDNIFMTAESARTGLYLYCERLETVLASPDSVLRTCWVAAWPEVAPAPATFWQWVDNLNKTIRDMKTRGNADPTYRDIVGNLFPAVSQAAEIAGVSHVIFATICCVTAMGRPTIAPLRKGYKDTVLEMNIYGAETEVSVKTFIDAPISNSFVDSRKLTRVYRSGTPGNNAAHLDSLALNVVEYALFRKIGVKIKFVSNIGDHLGFDITTRELSIFAWPSFCLVNLAGGAGNRTGVPLVNLYDIALCRFCRYALDFQVLTLRLFTCRLAKGLRASASEPTIFEEVILSMRLLFSRSKESRKIFRERVGQEEQPVDPFLGGAYHQ